MALLYLNKTKIRVTLYYSFVYTFLSGGESKLLTHILIEVTVLQEIKN